MLKKNNQAEEKSVENTLNMNMLDTKVKPGSMMSSLLISVGLSAAGVYFIIKITDPVERWVCGLGLVFVAICVFFISMAGQKAESYRFEFVEGQGLKDFKLFYKGIEIHIDYKLDKYGKFMWGDYKSKAKCITYADDRKADLLFNNFTKYRIMNYLSGLFIQNDLMSKNAY